MVIIFNFVMSIVAVRVILTQNKKNYIQNERKNMKKLTFKTIISITWLVILFGLGWVFGILTIRQASIAFKYIFVIFNGFQGFYFFLFICVLQKEARDFWAMIVTCGHYKWTDISSSSLNKLVGRSKENKVASKHSGLPGSPLSPTSPTSKARLLAFPTVRSESAQTSEVKQNVLETCLDLDTKPQEGTENKSQMELSSYFVNVAAEEQDTEGIAEHRNSVSQDKQTESSAVREETYERNGVRVNVSFNQSTRKAREFDHEVSPSASLQHVTQRKSSIPLQNKDLKTRTSDVSASAQLAAQSGSSSEEVQHAFINPLYDTTV